MKEKQQRNNGAAMGKCPGSSLRNAHNNILEFCRNYNSPLPPQLSQLSSGMQWQPRPQARWPQIQKASPSTHPSSSPHAMALPC